MKRAWNSISKAAASFAVVAMVIAGASTRTVHAKEWQANVGAQTRDLGKQALAFLSNELWIHAGDSIRWTFSTNELHTVTFLKPNRMRPPLLPVSGVFVGCPGATPDGSSFDNSACVTSGPAVTGQTYTVHFPAPGNFKLVCLVHARMTGAVHVLNLPETLPHDQAFYDRQADNQRATLLAEASGLEGQGTSEDEEEVRGRQVTAGISAILGTGGGSQVAAVMRFLGATTVVRVGDTVEWTNLAPTVPHTVTFGTEPANPFPPSLNVNVDSDGARHAVIGSPSDAVNSGFVFSPNQETIGLPQSPLDVTRFRVTFTVPGTFNYICSLHDDLGMKGTVIVHP